MSREELLEELKKRYPKKMFSTTEDFGIEAGGVWTSGEDRDQLHAGLPLFSYYSQDGGSKDYIFGVRTFLHNWLEENGWSCEWYDAGTVMIWKL